MAGTGYPPKRIRTPECGCRRRRFAAYLFLHALHLSKQRRCISKCVSVLDQNSLNSHPSFVQYSLDLKIDFPGLGNALLAEVPVHIASGLSATPPSYEPGSDQPPPPTLDLPPYVTAFSSARTCVFNFARFEIVLGIGRRLGRRREGREVKFTHSALHSLRPVFGMIDTQLFLSGYYDSYSPTLSFSIPSIFSSNSFSLSS